MPRNFQEYLDDGMIFHIKLPTVLPVLLQDEFYRIQVECGLLKLDKKSLKANFLSILFFTLLYENVII